MRFNRRTSSFCDGDAEAIPAETTSFDVALVNGIFNLNPTRGEIFRDLARVVQPAGVVFADEIVLKAALPNPLE